MTTVGSLCSGVGGLDLAVCAHYDAEVAWHAETDPHACTVLAERWPGVPNLSDITTVGWGAVPTVDVLCAGFPCQDVSTAGQRAGLAEGTRTGLWFEIAKAIRALRPSIVVLENVPGLLSGGSEEIRERIRCLCGWPDRRGGLRRHQHGDHSGTRSDVRLGRDRDVSESETRPRLHEDDLWRGSSQDQGCRTPESGGVGLVPAGWRIRSTLAHLNTPLSTAQSRASAPSPGLPRSSPFAYGRWQQGEVDRGGTAPSEAYGGPVQTVEREGTGDGTRAWMDCPACGRRLGDPTGQPVWRSWFGTVLRDLAVLGFDARWGVVRASDAGAPHRRARLFVVAHAESTGRQGGHGRPAARRRTGPLPGGRPPPDAGSARRREIAESAHGDEGADAGGAESLHHELGRASEGGDAPWGPYQPAITRWERILGRPAPAPLVGRQLNARFVEWLMGLDEGWVTDLVRNRHALRLLGNGVVPQQAVLALELLNPVDKERAA